MPPLLAAPTPRRQHREPSGNPAGAWRRPHRLRGSRRRIQSPSTGYPVLEFRISTVPCRPRKPLETQRWQRQGRPGVWAPGAGSKSLAPKILCVNLGTTDGSPEGGPGVAGELAVGVRGRSVCPPRGGGSKMQVLDLRCFSWGLTDVAYEGRRGNRRLSRGTQFKPAAASGPSAEIPKAQHRIPCACIPALCFRWDFAKETADTQRLLGQARPGFKAPCGGPGSQTPDIRCLTSRFYCGLPVRENACFSCGGLGKPPQVSRLPVAAPKVQHRISGA